MMAALERSGIWATVPVEVDEDGRHPVREARVTEALTEEAGEVAM
jgi:hypothetical protein